MNRTVLLGILPRGANERRTEEDEADDPAGFTRTTFGGGAFGAVAEFRRYGDRKRDRSVPVAV